MFRQLRSFLELIRFSHTLFALPFALTSAVLAWKQPAFIGSNWPASCCAWSSPAARRWRSTAWPIAASTPRNPRTAGRHLPAGRLTPAAVWLFTLLCAAGFRRLDADLSRCSANPWPLYLSVPVLVFVCAYSCTKRFTALSHFWLGASLLPGAAGGVDRHPRRRRLDDAGRAAGARRGRPVLGGGLRHPLRLPGRGLRPPGPAAQRAGRARRPARVCAWRWSVMSSCWRCWRLSTGRRRRTSAGFTWPAWPPSPLLLAYEHWLVRPDDLSRVNQAFFQVNGVISVGLFVVVLVQLAVGA